MRVLLSLEWGVGAVRERLIRQPTRVVPYPPDCRCAAKGADECRAWDRLQAVKHGTEPKPEGACPCACHTLEPSPWDWDDEEGEE